jgi:signal transduction histidine kinase
MSACECPLPVQSKSEEQSLLAAFSSFTEAAGALERSYNQLQEEVARLREQLRAANAELEQQREAQQRLQALAEVSTLLAHEIRNPLGSLELFAGLLAETESRPEPLQWVHQMQAGLRALSATVNNVLHLHSQTLELASTDLGELLHWTIEFLRPLAEQSGVQLELLSDFRGVAVAADPHRLQQVILNIALNAFHAMPNGGQLKISGCRLADESGNVKIQFIDTGPGIAPEHLGQIFQPGFTTRSGSAGLGLAVCKQIMEQHGGAISVSSRASQGATFTLTLPVENSE